MFATWSYKDSNGDEPIGSKTDNQTSVTGSFLGKDDI